MTTKVKYVFKILKDYRSFRIKRKFLAVAAGLVSLQLGAWNFARAILRWNHVSPLH